MEKVSFSIWTDDYGHNASQIDKVTQQINECKYRVISHDEFGNLKRNITDVLSYWTGNTYVGMKKKVELSQAFQLFFFSLYDWLLLLEESSDKKYSSFANEALYQGKLYRYLGHGDSTEDVYSRVEPQYNDIYVSWSKEEKNSYIESKLDGTKTILTCELKGNHRGIDLEGFGVSKANEREVVFPTLQNTIIDIKYIDVTYEEDYGE